MSEFPGKDQGVQYDEHGLIIVPDFKSGDAPSITPPTEQDAMFVDVHGAVVRDAAIGRKYMIPSRSRDGVVYIMVPTGKIVNGRVEMSGPNVKDPNEIGTKSIAVEDYLPMHDREEDLERARGDRKRALLGGGVVESIEAAASAGIEQPLMVGGEVDPRADFRTKITDIISQIDWSIKNAGHVDSASMCGQRAEEIKKVLNRGAGDQNTIAILHKAINILEQASSDSRLSGNNYATVTALSNARKILSSL